MSDFLTRISHPDVQQFITEQEKTDVQKLLLRHREILGVPSSWVANQIVGRRKAREKLPTWYRTPGIVYPPVLNLEQSSSEVTARYKQGLVGGHHAADLTGGFGVDTWFLSRVFSTVDYVEPDAQLLDITRHNLTRLGADNIRYHAQTAEQFLQYSPEVFDLLYADPSRREGARRKIRMADCAPDVLTLQQNLLARARQVLIKTSPLLDLKQAYREIPSIDQIIVLAVDNECKELLLVLRRDAREAEPLLHAVNLAKDGEPTTLAFTWSQEKSARSEMSEPKTYLYEPNTAILKAGAFKLIGQQFNLCKLGRDSHLYTSDDKYDEFPGRLFRIIEQVSLRKGLHDHIKDGRINIMVRNYPLSVEEIRKKTGLEEGGLSYLICTRTTKPLALLAQRIR